MIIKIEKSFGSLYDDIEEIIFPDKAKYLGWRSEYGDREEKYYEVEGNVCVVRREYNEYSGIIGKKEVSYKIIVNKKGVKLEEIEKVIQFLKQEIKNGNMVSSDNFIIETRYDEAERKLKEIVEEIKKVLEE